MKKMMAVTSKDKIVSYFLTERHASSPDVNKISLLVTLMVFLHFNAKEKVKITNAIKNVNYIPSRHERKSLFNQRRKKKNTNWLFFWLAILSYTRTICVTEKEILHTCNDWRRNYLNYQFEIKMWCESQKPCSRWKCD